SHKKSGEEFHAADPSRVRGCRASAAVRRSGARPGLAPAPGGAAGAGDGRSQVGIGDPREHRHDGRRVPAAAQGGAEGRRHRRQNIAYGEDARQILDVYQPIWRSGAPVVIFIHGGAYVRGDKDAYGEMYGNIATWFARQGLLGVNATYRLAPGAQWPSGADDVRGMVKWAKDNAAKFGGDGNRIYLIGHSAGATHVASYVFDKSL